MNLNHLAIFRAVAEAGSVSGGAERLMISQPAVSRQLALFERNLGVRLFERLPRGVRPTHAGEVLAGFARRIFQLEADAAAAIDEVRGAKQGRVRVGASTTIAVYLLPEVVVHFRQTFPGVQVLLDVGRSAHIARAVESGDLDIGLVEVSPESTELESRVFKTDELVAISRHGHPLARKKTVTPRQLCDQPFVVRDTGSDTKSFVERELATRGLTVEPVLSLGSTEAVKRAVAAGIGVAIVSRLSIDLELEARRLAVIPVTTLKIRRPLFLLLRRGMPASPAIEAFAALFENAGKSGKV